MRDFISIFTVLFVLGREDCSEYLIRSVIQTFIDHDITHYSNAEIQKNLNNCFYKRYACGCV